MVYNHQVSKYEQKNDKKKQKHRGNYRVVECKRGYGFLELFADMFDVSAYW